MFRTQILVDNVANAGQGEWGFSAVIEADNKRILFDVGASALFRKNKTKGTVLFVCLLARPFAKVE